MNKFKPFLEKYEEKFGFLSELIHGMVKTDYVNTILVSGPPGIGKTHTIDNILSDYESSETHPIRYNRLSGKITPLAFYNMLKENATVQSVNFFDDADTILSDPISLKMV
jgi:Cdc6-like AAA superfamily ATPase